MGPLSVHIRTIGVEVYSIYSLLNRSKVIEFFKMGYNLERLNILVVMRTKVDECFSRQKRETTGVSKWRVNVVKIFNERWKEEVLDELIHH